MIFEAVLTVSSSQLAVGSLQSTSDLRPITISRFARVRFPICENAAERSGVMASDSSERLYARRSVLNAW